MTKSYFMVDFTLPPVLDDAFVNTIPDQRVAVSKLFASGKLVNYALAFENSKLWAVFMATSEMEVLDMIGDLPLTEFMDVKISILNFYNAVFPQMPAFSVN